MIILSAFLTIGIPLVVFTVVFSLMLTGANPKEHHKFPSPIHDHCNISGHEVAINNFTIIGREDQNLTRAIKEALFIRVNDPSLNRNIAKYHLPHIRDEVLHKTSDLKLNH